MKTLLASSLVAATALLATTVSPVEAAPAATGKSAPFGIGANDFLLNGKPFQIRCGEMHFARVPRAYWRHRLQMLKAMGLNTVCAYMFWNAHEAQEGKFNFSGEADVAEFCRLAKQEGLYVILRPGPYACAEWEFGGFPSWLLKTSDIKLRTRDPRYLAAVRKYLMQVGKQLAPQQVTHGGPILMVQVENEYGSYGSDKEYMGIVRDNLVEAGFDVPLFHCDGPSQLPRDHRDDIFAVVNFGGNPQACFEALRKVQPTGPLMCGEYYPGWFDSWGRAHHTGNAEHVVNELKWMLDNKASFSIYMAHGGTSFAFTAGANSPPFSPQSTSYDYDAPVSEAGWDTPKFHQIRELFSKYLQEGETLPPVPARNPVVTVAPFALNEVSPLMGDKLPKAIVSERPQTFENLNQINACVLYRSTLPAGPEARLVLRDLHDYAHIYLNGQKIATLDRRRGQSTLALPARAQGGVLDILVDSYGRVNYGGDIHDRKGITERVELVSDAGTTEIKGWSHYLLPLDTVWKGRKYTAGKSDKPAFYRGTFDLTNVGDTFLDTSAWNRGVVWVNGHNLGRYWRIGPQQTLYVPAPWLKTGRNEVVVYESDGLGASAATMRGLTEPMLDTVNAEPGRAHRKAGQNLDLSTLTPTLSGTLANTDAWQTIALPAPATGRYLTLESLNSHPGDAFAALSELYVQDTPGHDMARTKWKVVYADSEEFSSEDGSADNVFDLQPTTYWHSQWSGQNAPKHPHQIVIDLGQDVSISALRMLQRPGTAAASARIKDFRVFVTPQVPPGL
ncbi:beta-galactosidase [bacterium]|nr:MAG: beta-galactosidase [bacterium]